MCEVGLYHCVTFTDVLSVNTLLAGRVVIAGLSDKDSIINTPRQDAIHLIKLASRHLDWNTCDLFDLKKHEQKLGHHNKQVQPLRLKPKGVILQLARSAQNENDNTAPLS